MADLDQVAERLRNHIQNTSASYGPGPVLLTVIDGSGQFVNGYVWCTFGDKSVQCIAPAGVGDLRTATSAAPMIIWAWPPNPNQAAGFYLAIGFAQNGATSNGFPAGRIPPSVTTVINDPDGNPISGSGTVTSVDFTASPGSVFNVSGAPVTTSGTIALSMDSQAANIVLAGPSSGGAATPAFRSLVSDDIPSLAASKIASGTLALARGGTNADLSATGPGFLYQASSGANVTVVSAYDVIKKAGSAATQRRNLNFIDGTGISITVSDNAGTGNTDVTIDASGGSGANTALSNLASVAINTSLVSDTDNTDSLGSASVKWAATHTNLLNLEERSAPSTPASGDVYIYADALHNERQISSLGQDDIKHHGDFAGFKSVASSTSEEVMYSRTIKANSLGAYGAWESIFRGSIYNESGANRTFVVRAYVGGTGGTKVYDSGSLTCNGTRRFPFKLVMGGANTGATNAQSVQCAFTDWNSTKNGVTATSSTPVDQAAGAITNNETARDTTADMDITFTIQLGTSNADLRAQRIYALTHGPYNATS